MQSSVSSIKLIKKKKIEKSVSDCSSAKSPVDSHYSFQIDESYFEDDHFHSSFRQQSQSDYSESIENSLQSEVAVSSNDEIYESFEETGIRIFGDDVDDEILSTRPPYSNRKSIKTMTRIDLPSGRCLDLSFVGDSTPSIRDIPDTPSTSTQPKLTTRLEQPDSIK